MSLSEYFEEHEERRFIAQALATAVAIITVKALFPGLVSFFFLVLPVVFLIGIKLQALSLGVDATELLREHITFLPVMRSEDERRSEVKPWVTYGIIFANVLIFYFVEPNLSPAAVNQLVFLPHDPDPFTVPLSAFTSIFLHASNGHLWGNMTFLWVVGSAVERRVGALRFSWLYLVTGLIGGLVFVLVEFLFHDRAGHILGASGAIAGIMGIFAVRCYFKTMIFPVPLLGIFSLILPISLKVKLNSLLIMALFFLADLSGGIGQLAGEGGMVGHWAHLGGMISGMLIAGYLKLGEDAVEERHLEIGIKASQAAMGYGGGERSLKIALERSPDNVDALLGMARLKTKFGGTPEGRDFYERSLRLLLKERPGEAVEALREYQSIFLAVPADQKLLSGFVELLKKGGETELLIACLEKLVAHPETQPQAREKLHFQLATLLEFTSCFDAARSSFAHFVHLYPTSLLADQAREKAGGVVFRDKVAAPPVKAPAAKSCGTCGKEMVQRTVTSGAKKGETFWVCTDYPGCRTVEPVAPPVPEVSNIAPPEPRYRVVLDGTIGFSCEPEETKAQLAQLFRCSKEQADRLCSGNPTVLKKGLAFAEAQRYKNAISRTGALCSVEREEPVAAPAPIRPAEVAEEGPVPATPAPPAAPAAAVVTCPKCGLVQEKGDSCVSCGIYFAKYAKVQAKEFEQFREYLPSQQQRSEMPERQARQWAMWCHLTALSGTLIPLGNLLFPFIIWRWKRGESAFVDFHGRAALNFQLTLFVFSFGIGLVGAMTGFLLVILAPLLGLVGLYALFVILNAAIKSQRGDLVEIALSAEFIK